MKPGDIVCFNAAAASQPWYPRWVELNGSGPFVITKVMPSPGTCGYWISHLDGPITDWDDDAFGKRKSGIWERWLQPQPFLTAVKNAIDLKGETQHGTDESR